MARKLLPLAVVVALAAVACAEPPNPDVDFGSGTRFVPFVADSLNNSGLHPSVVIDGAGLPVVTYFGFEEEVAEGDFPQTRPVGAPTLPGVLTATVSEDGIWTRGATAIAAQIPSVGVAFAPAFDDAIADLTPEEVTGLRSVVDGDTLHVVWGSADGVFYAAGSSNPGSTQQFELQRVTTTPPVGPSIVVGADGTPVIAYSTSTSAAASIEVATPEGEGWAIETVATVAGCETCRTAAAVAGGFPVVAWTDGGDGVGIARRVGSTWLATDVAGSGGQGLAAAATAEGVALSFYDGEQVVLATGPAAGPFDAAPIGPVAPDSATDEGAGTSVAAGAGEDGSLAVAWFDAEEGVTLVTGGGPENIAPVETEPDTSNGAMPSVAIAPEEGTIFLAWYDPLNQDLLLGEYGDVQGLAIADPSPEPSGPPVSVGVCTEAEDGAVEIVARGLAFDFTCVEVPAGEPITVLFDNQDEATQHNIAIYPDQADLANFVFRGETFPGVDSREYAVDPLDEADYYFQCDVHPDMNGTWSALEGGGGGDGGGETGATGATGTATGATGGTGATGATGG